MKDSTEWDQSRQVSLELCDLDAVSKIVDGGKEGHQRSQAAEGL